MTEIVEAVGANRRRALVRAFLIADVRGYTRFTVEHGDEAAARLASRFAEIARQILTARGGDNLEFRGDEVMAVFLSPRQALQAAVAFQKQLHKEMRADPSLPLHVGVGLDAGEAVPVADGFRGGALNLAARLCSLAGPGEIFASEGLIHLVRRTEGLTFIDRGEVRLKGLPAPVRVIQIAPEGEMPTDLPPLQAILVTHPTNLPDEPTPFIGRERQVTELCALLHRPTVRLVTLTGPGGTGKTRLALQMASTLLDDYGDGVFFVSLGSLADPSLVASSVAETLGVQEIAGRPPGDALIQYLRDKRLLLVLDNFEHLLDAGEFVACLLDSCRFLGMVVTSRIPLHLVREHEYAVPPLSVPDPGQVVPVEALSQYEAVALFIDRARAAKASFAITDENAPAVADICYRLDGLALAIELAAARIKLFPPQALLARLSSRLKLLTGGARDRPGRQQTLRGALEWSYNLLDEDERLLFARLSIFAGGCTLEAAEAVCGLSTGVELDVLEGIASLVDKSLLREEGEDEPRYVMLETIREYALECLTVVGEEGEIRVRHAEQYLSLAEHAESHLRTRGGHVWLQRLDREHDNLRAALRWTLDTGREEITCRMVGALEMFWVRRGHLREARTWVTEVLERTDPAPSARRVRVMRLAARQGILQGNLDGTAALLKEALEMARQTNQRDEEADILGYLGICAARQERYADAVAFWEQGLALAVADGDLRRRAWYLDNLGGAAKFQGDFARAAELVQESLALYRRIEDEPGISEVLQDLSYIAFAQGDLERAENLMLECLALVRHHREKDRIAYAFEGLARVAASRGEAKRAARLWGAGETLREDMDVPLMPQQQALHDRALAELLVHADQTLVAIAWREGRSMSLEEALRYALKEEN